MDNVLVTGGTGMVGANCILQLLQQGYNVKTTLRYLSKKNTPTSEGISKYSPDVLFSLM